MNRTHPRSTTFPDPTLFRSSQLQTQTTVCTVFKAKNTQPPDGIVEQDHLIEPGFCTYLGLTRNRYMQEALGSNPDSPIATSPPHHRLKQVPLAHILLPYIHY